MEYAASPYDQAEIVHRADGGYFVWFTTKTVDPAYQGPDEVLASVCYLRGTAAAPIFLSHDHVNAKIRDWYDPNDPDPDVANPTDPLL
jgi:hypothetical protein